MKVTLRGRTYYLRRNVPRQFAAVEPRKEVWLSLKTDSRSEALARAPGAWRNLVSGWEAMRDGDSTDAETRFKAAQEVARSRGFRFMPVERVAELPPEKLLERIEAAMTPAGTLNARLYPGIIGTVPKPEVTVNRALEIYWQISAEKTDGKSEDQLRRWKNPRKKAFANLVSVIGDIPLSEITPDDLLDFRDWWFNKITDEGLTKNSANKDFTHITSALREVNTMKRLGLSLPLDSLKAFSENGKADETRAPFSEKWIREKILAPGALDGLNLEARCILLGMVNTGYRPSEAQDLLPEHIRLDTNVPHITIEPVNRTLKTKTSQRTIPLVGISLEAFRACPGGFPRYAGKAGLSATVNKYLRENKLVETPEHTMYGLRHSFEDRLLDRDVDERIRRDLMGHALGRERYGKGASLEKLAGILQLIAL